MKINKRNTIIGIIGLILVFIAMNFVGVFSIITVSDDFSLSVTQYVSKTGSAGNSKLIGPFNESAEFDFQITKSVQSNDVSIYVLDGSGDSKLLFSQQYDWGCNGAQLVNHPYGPKKLRVTQDGNVISLVDLLDDDKLINYVTKSGEFGEPPYYIKFNVAEARGTRCSNSGISYADGRINVRNILLKDYEPEPTPVLVDCYTCLNNNLTVEQFNDVCPNGYSNQILTCEAPKPVLVDCYICLNNNLTIEQFNDACPIEYSNEVLNCSGNSLVIGDVVDNNTNIDNVTDKEYNISLYFVICVIIIGGLAFLYERFKK